MNTCICPTAEVGFKDYRQPTTNQQDNQRWRENWFSGLRLALEAGFHARVGHQAG